MKVFIEANPLYTEEVKYIFSVFAFNKGVSFEWTNDFDSADLTIGHSSTNSLRISISFFEFLSKGVYDNQVHFKESASIILENGEEDVLSTTFYILSCAQEFALTERDRFGRFKYQDCFQARFGLIRENVVQKQFDKLASRLSLNQQVGVRSFKSRIFLSHDIDTVYGALIQDGFNAFKKMRPDLVFKIFLENVIGNPSWKNMDKIMSIESEYDFYSTFFWLVNKGRVNQWLSNSDYDINDSVIQAFISDISESKWTNGLHKSAAEDSFTKELEKLGVSVQSNRYHYLKFDLKNDFPKIESAGLKFDSSLCFAETGGFRNGYGQPYRPYNFSARKAFSFIECPLNIMDTTAFNYQKISGDRFAKETISFCENNSMNCVLSVLFHNNFISNYKYKDYLSAFKKLLSYFHESGMKPIGPDEIIKEYYYEY